MRGGEGTGRGCRDRGGAGGLGWRGSVESPATAGRAGGTWAPQRAGHRGNRPTAGRQLSTTTSDAPLAPLLLLTTWAPCSARTSRQNPPSPSWSLSASPSPPTRSSQHSSRNSHPTSSTKGSAARTCSNLGSDAQNPHSSKRPRSVEVTTTRTRRTTTSRATAKCAHGLSLFPRVSQC